MQFAERHPFEVTFKVAKLNAEVLSQNLTPSSSVECLLKVRPGEGAACDLVLVCRLRQLSFAYVEAHVEASDCRGVLLRFDTDCQERLLCRLPLPTIGKNAHFLATSMKVAGHLQLEPGCGPLHFAPDGFSDVSFVVGDQELHLHRSVLAKASPVFCAMLLGDFREAGDSAAIQLPGKSLGTFVELLATVYPPQLEIHHGRAKTLLGLFAEYQMEHMLAKCERALLQSPLYSHSLTDAGDPEAGLPQSWMEELMDHAFLASVYSLQQLQARAIGLLASVRTGEYQKAMKELLPDDILSQIFARRVELLEATIERLNEELDASRQAACDA